MSERKLRKDDCLISIPDWQLKAVGAYDFTKAQQLPDYEYLYSRFYTILHDKGEKEKDRFGSAVYQVVTEFRDAWITMNVYPMSYTGIHNKFSKLLKDFNTLVTRGEKTREKAWWKTRVETIRSSRKNGVDIFSKSTDPETLKSMELLYGVKMTERDRDFYTDNCVIASWV